jgi:hypothetical protein
VDLRDFIVTPFIILGVYVLAYYLRPRLCDEENYKYFLPALTVKIVGALILGLIYQFYYDGGDTYNFHTLGSRVIWEAFFDDPSAALRMIFNPPDFPHLYKYTSRIAFYSDPGSMVVIRIAALFDLLTFSSYLGTAVLFAFFSFFGFWFFFLAFYGLFPHLARQIAICTLFIPSVVFWGSGILKDTIVVGALGVLTYVVRRIFIDKKPRAVSLVVLIISSLIIFSVKKYVLLCYLPAVLFWIYMSNLQKIRSIMLRLMLVPIIIVVAGISGYYSVMKVGEGDSRYALDKLSKTAQVTAYDIAFYSGKNAGSGYVLGELDGSFGSMISLFPKAVNVALFRPYPWETRNPLMFLSSIEAVALLIITLTLFITRPIRSMRALADPTIVFCLVFSITFAFAVGVSTFNFGTLTRYRIPMLPFYLLALVLIADKSNRHKKLDELELTE